MFPVRGGNADTRVDLRISPKSQDALIVFARTTVSEHVASLRERALSGGSAPADEVLQVRRCPLGERHPCRTASEGEQNRQRQPKCHPSTSSANSICLSCSCPRKCLPPARAPASLESHFTGFVVRRASSLPDVLSSRSRTGNRQGEIKVRSMRTLASMAASAAQCLALLASGIAPASAAETQWNAVQHVGTARDCSVSMMNVRWHVSETATRITLQPDSKSSDVGWRLRRERVAVSGDVPADIHHAYRAVPRRSNVLHGIPVGLGSQIPERRRKHRRCWSLSTSVSTMRKTAHQAGLGAANGCVGAGRMLR